MILVTLGTHEQPFERALDAVSALAGEDELTIQHGSTPPRPELSNTTWFDYLALAELSEYMRTADVVITHAGVGSAVTALRVGKKPIMLPRLARYGEHVDDHQLQLAERLSERDSAFVWEDGDSLSALVSSARGSEVAEVPPRRGALRQALVEAAALG